MVLVGASSCQRRLDGGTPGGGSDEFRSTALQVQSPTVAANGLFLITAGMTGFACETGMVSWGLSQLCKGILLTILGGMF